MLLALINKVKEYISRENLIEKGDTVIVAVSGGPDSFSLLHMLKQISPQFNLKLVVAHLNHCLRNEAGIEEAAVNDIASSWSLPFESKTVDIRSLKKEKGISEEEAGRLARYNFLVEMAEKYGASKIALGHHLDDQAETVLLNVLRGTGVDGLAGILPRSKRGGFFLIRPLMCLRRSEIEEYCHENNLRPFTDSSNLETNYTRNKMRLELIPQLERGYNPRIREALSGLASLAAADRFYLQARAREKYLEIARLAQNKIIFRKKELVALPSALQSRVIHVALKKFLSPGQIGRQHIGQVLRLLETGITGRQATLPGGVLASLEYYNLVIYGPGYREKKPAVKELNLPGKVFLPGGAAIRASIIDADEINFQPSANRACLDYDSLPPGPLKVCPRWPGARFYPQGAGGSKKLKSFLIDQKVPREKRDTLPLVAAGNEIIWVTGVRIAEPYRVTGKTKRVLLLEYLVPRLPSK